MILSSCVFVFLIVKRKRMFENASSFYFIEKTGILPIITLKIAKISTAIDERMFNYTKKANHLL